MDSNLKLAYQRDAQNGFEVEQLLKSEGFRVLEVVLNNRILDLDSRMQLTIDPNEALACIKEKNGILFFMDTARDLVVRGKEAAKQLVVS